MTPGWAWAPALFGILSGCAGNASEAVDAAPADAMRSVACVRAGTSSVTGSGPAGSLASSYVYTRVLTGFCPDTLVMIVTTDDPLAWPYLDDSVQFEVPISQSIGGSSEWSGVFPATILGPDRTALASGTLEVDRASPGYGGPTYLRATARFADGNWQFTATIDTPYCSIITCL